LTPELKYGVNIESTKTPSLNMESSRRGIFQSSSDFLQKMGSWGAVITPTKFPIGLSSLFMMPTVGSTVNLTVSDDNGGDNVIKYRRAVITGMFSWYKFDQRERMLAMSQFGITDNSSQCLQQCYVVEFTIENVEKTSLKIVFLDEANAAVLLEDEERDDLTCVDYFTNYTVVSTAIGL
jgi:hypothetical protein